MGAKKKNLIQRLFIAIVLALLISNFIIPTTVNAEVDGGFFGYLFKPVQKFVLGLGDTIMTLLQESFVGDDRVTIYSDVNGVDIPNYRISPEKIFTNSIPAFDINFFNPMQPTEFKSNYQEKLTDTVDYISEKYVRYHPGTQDPTTSGYTTGNYPYTDNDGNSRIAVYDDSMTFDEVMTQYGWSISPYTHPNQMSLDEFDPNAVYTGSYNGIISYYWYENGVVDGVNTRIAKYKLEHITDHVVEKDANGQETGWEKNVEIVKVTKYAISQVATNSGVKKSTADILRSTIAYWYTSLRNIAIIGMLSMLVYTGIRIVISSTAPQKSKYKELLKNWAVALCLLFTMHYLMAFVVTMADAVTDSLLNENSRKRSKLSG